ncbi:MAG: flippase activity-associated protein Agl23 [Planctomycetota bacterium]
MNRTAFILWFLVAVAVAAGLRCIDLDDRPVHTDEAVHAFKFRDLWLRGTYRYDARDYHGPTIYYATLPNVWLSSAHSFAETRIWMYRLAPAIAGVGVAALSLLLVAPLGRVTAVVSALLTAVSPAMSYYSRYYIQETFLVLFTFFTVLCCWRGARRRDPGWAVGAGAGVGLMYATKETWAIAFVAIVLAGAATGAWRKWVCKKPVDLRQRVRPRALAVAAVTAVVVATAAISVGFTQLDNVAESIGSYVNYVGKAGGDGKHTHPWYWYARLLAWARYDDGPVWTEGFILLLALLGGVSGFVRRGRPSPPQVRFLTFFGLLLAAGYSALPYKTPWLVLGFLHVFILLAGVAAQAAYDHFRGGKARLVIWAVLLLGTAHLGFQAVRANFLFADDDRNPWVYSHPSEDVEALSGAVDAVAEVHPRGKRMIVQVAWPMSDYWPLPWYLREYPNVGWYGQIPDNPTGAVLITRRDWRSRLARSLDQRPPGERTLHVSLTPERVLQLRPGAPVSAWVPLEFYNRLTAPPLPEDVNATNDTGTDPK